MAQSIPRHNRFHSDLTSKMTDLDEKIRSFVIPNSWVARSRKTHSEGTTVYDEETTLMMKKPLYMMKKPFLWWRNHFIWWRNRSTQNHTVKKPVWNWKSHGTETEVQLTNRNWNSWSVTIRVVESIVPSTGIQSCVHKFLTFLQGEPCMYHLSWWRRSISWARYFTTVRVSTPLFLKCWIPKYPVN